jgi:hypothetical protein
VLQDPLQPPLESLIRIEYLPPSLLYTFLSHTASMYKSDCDTSSSSLPSVTSSSSYSNSTPPSPSPLSMMIEVDNPSTTPGTSLTARDYKDPAITPPNPSELKPSSSSDLSTRSHIFNTQSSAPSSEIHGPPLHSSSSSLTAFSETKQKKQRKSSTYHIFLRNLHILFKKHQNRVPMGLEASYWRAMPSEQRKVILANDPHVSQIHIE